MNLQEYIIQAKRTENTPDLVINGSLARILHASMGLVTEAGEFQDALKKHLMYGKKLDEVNLAEELGDLCWYIAIACDALKIDPQEILYRNIAKLQARYPEKFTQDAAINRDLEKEREVLEKGNTVICTNYSHIICNTDRVKSS